VKTLFKFLAVLLVSTVLAGEVLAQSQVDEQTNNIQNMVDVLNADIESLEFLHEKVKVTDESDREFLVYRQDERSFRLLSDFNQLVKNLGKLSGEATQYTEMQQQLVDLSSGVGDAVFNRITEIKARISKVIAKIPSLSGGARISAEAYIHSMEGMRISYYEALVAHLDARKNLGLSSEILRQQLDPKIYLYAETLAGRIEYTASALKQIRLRLSQAPNDADLQAAQKDLKTRHSIHVSRLEAMIPVLDRLKLPSSEYKTIMLRQATNLSVSFFSFKSILSVIKSGWSALISATENNAADIIIRFLLFLAVLFIFRILSRLTRRIVRAASDRSSLDLSILLKNILVSTSGGLVMGIGVLMALSQVGISLAPMLAGLGVAGFIIGFALQDTLGNFAAGAMILIYRPFDVDDFVEVTGASGLVKKMNLVSTTIATFDNQTLVVPNSKIWGDVIKNVTAQTERRVDLEFGIGYDDDIEHAERVLMDVVTQHDKVLKDPQPNIKLHTLGDSSVNFIVRPWVKTDDYWDVYWDIIREVKMRFDREGISIPFPQRDVHVYAEKEVQD
jgi:small conductance mechanosensitive channel